MFSTNSKEDKFYKLFIETSQIIYETAKMLGDYIEDLSEAESKLASIKEMEHKGDQLQHEILQQLNKTFLTPFDREDIYLIAKNMDDVIDYMEASAGRFVMFNVDKPTPEAKQLCSLIYDCSVEIITLLEELKNMRTSKVLPEKIIEINRLEEEGDRVSRKAIKDLFRSDIPVIEVIKWREIYQFLEDTLDACEEVANVIEGVVMKNA
jgi:uncharacterized protein